LKKADDQQSAIKYGTIDNGNEIASSEEYQETAKTVAKELHMSTHEITDSKGEKHTLHTSVDMKGVIGTDSRHYMMDLYRTVPVDVEFLEATEKQKDTNPYPHKMCLLRHELIEIFYVNLFNGSKQR
jgi:protein TIF31